MRVGLDQLALDQVRLSEEGQVRFDLDWIRGVKFKVEKKMVGPRSSVFRSDLVRKIRFSFTSLNQSNSNGSTPRPDEISSQSGLTRTTARSLVKAFGNILAGLIA